MNILRRLPLVRLLALCALALGIGVGATAIAFALDTGPVPPAKPLAQAIHDAIAGASSHPVQGVSASITWTDHLLEGANLASGGRSGQLTSSPLVAGASGRLWIGDRKLRLELQSERGDTQILYDGHTLTVYDAASNTEYRYTPPAGEAGEGGAAEPIAGGPRAPARVGEAPSVAKIEEAIARLSQHAIVSGASPSDIAGQPAYTVRVSPKQAGSLLAGAELSFDANRGVPLRAAVYSTESSEPVLELAAGEISYGPVESSVFELNPPSDVKLDELKPPSRLTRRAEHPARPAGEHGAKLTTHGAGPGAVAVLASSRHGEARDKRTQDSGSQGSAESQALEGLPKVSIEGTEASELRTELGTILSFERGGVRYLLAGAVGPAEVEAVARGL